MRKILVGLSLFLIFFSITAISQRILLSHKAILLEPHGEYYSFPESYNITASGYHFVFVGGVYRVCHLNPQPRLVNLDMLRVHIELGEQKFWWNCYAYDPRFFEIDF
ncbi:hypothetical protein [Legionella jamestowniensis]|uniref:Uncharacterized protein n=1 Tax=Legionella jamestowniensis TaxID=455 RepID=A0A0W0UJE8_9GAMM|nr:hypothetical protein [Legionella jamestowniensis]KTD07750.1 hypothetical protein Ljam_1945 [Legionella jamestowniensis]OCH99484.1 hypothetical protein A8135_07325 [Legionella jamestowniensis]SFL61605.1 hypothetical protein SAMN02746073_1066 [Legionella jamestowniensis DSM 19215]